MESGYFFLSMRYVSISVLIVFNIDMDEVRFALSTIEPKDMIASAASVAIIMSITNTSVSVKPLLFDTGNLIHPVAKPYCEKTITPLGGKVFPRRVKTVLICIAQIVGGIKVICKTALCSIKEINEKKLIMWYIKN